MGHYSRQAWNRIEWEECTNEKRQDQIRVELTTKEKILCELVQDGVHKRMDRTSKNLFS